MRFICAIVYLPYVQSITTLTRTRTRTTTITTFKLIDCDARRENLVIQVICMTGRILPRDLVKPSMKDTKVLKYLYSSLSCTVCIPVYTLLLAIGNPSVDLFSLDIEGAELPVIKSIPFDKVLCSIANVPLVQPKYCTMAYITILPMEF